ncbi:unnamed protein product, partial [Durusdinium trenchii]
MTSSSKPAKKDEDGDKSIRLLFLRLPPWHTWRSSSNSSVNAQLLDVQPGARVTQNELPNQGLEAFTFRRKTLVAGLEGPLVQDDPQVRRIMEVDTEGRLLWSGFLLVDATTPPPLLLSELAALELNRSGGTAWWRVAVWRGGEEG